MEYFYKFVEAVSYGWIEFIEVLHGFDVGVLQGVTKLNFSVTRG